MAKEINEHLLHRGFWTHMEKNSQVVQRMDPWVKGSPVNRRTPNETEQIQHVAADHSNQRTPADRDR